MPLVTLDPTAIPAPMRLDLAEGFGLYLQLTDAQGAPRSATKAEIEADLRKYLKLTAEGALLERDKKAVPPKVIDPGS